MGALHNDVVLSSFAMLYYTCSVCCMHCRLFTAHFSSVTSFRTDGGAGNARTWRLAATRPHGVVKRPLMDPQGSRYQINQQTKLWELSTPSKIIGGGCKNNRKGTTVPFIWDFATESCGRFPHLAVRWPP